MKSVETLLEHYSAGGLNALLLPPDALSRIPFSLVLLPLTARVLKDSRLAKRSFPSSVYSSLAASFTQRLSRIAAPSLFSEFSVFRLGSGYHSWEEMLSSDQHETDVYREFCERLLLPSRQRKLFSRYPYLARRLDTAVSQECENLSCLLERLTRDQMRLAQEFDGDFNVGRLVEISAPLSDPHLGHQTVRSLHFEGGGTLFYKPRGLHGDHIFHEVIEWLAERNDDVNFRAMRSVDRSTYGWSEAVFANACSSEGEVKQFYIRLGGMLALFFILGTTDMHHENVIACGSVPIPIDLETLVSAPLMSGADDWKHRLQIERVGILPRPRTLRVGGPSYDTSCIGGTGGQRTGLTVHAFENINTNYMTMRERESFTQQMANLPTIRGITIDICEYRREFLQGFRSVYDSLGAAARDRSFRHVIDAIRETDWRKVIRPTLSYALLLRYVDSLVALRRFHDVVEIEHEISRALRSTRISNNEDTIAAETRSLVNGDVPHFSISGGARRVWASDADTLLVLDRLRLSPVENIGRRIATISVDHRRRVERAIRRRLLSYVQTRHA